MLYKTTNYLNTNTFCHFCLCQINKNAKCYRHNIMLFCSKSCFDLWLKETPVEYTNRNKRMTGILIDGRIKQGSHWNKLWFLKTKIKKFFKIVSQKI